MSSVDVAKDESKLFKGLSIATFVFACATLITLIVAYRAEKSMLWPGIFALLAVGCVVGMKFMQRRVPRESKAPARPKRAPLINAPLDERVEETGIPALTATDVRSQVVARNLPPVPAQAPVAAEVHGDAPVVSNPVEISEEELLRELQGASEVSEPVVALPVQDDISEPDEFIKTLNLTAQPVVTKSNQNTREVFGSSDSALFDIEESDPLGLEDEVTPAAPVADLTPVAETVLLGESEVEAPADTYYSQNVPQHFDDSSAKWEPVKVPEPRYQRQPQAPQPVQPEPLTPPTHGEAMTEKPQPAPVDYQHMTLDDVLRRKSA